MQVPKDQITIILPTLNEEQAIGKIIDEIKQEGYTKHHANKSKIKII
ncbi:MAG: hypothetical protein H5T50_01120 [Nitrososphaeria archaeon]|nr:hypothetical protein [Nitrososphaeria archaeon]